MLILIANDLAIDPREVVCVTPAARQNPDRFMVEIFLRGVAIPFTLKPTDNTEQGARDLCKLVLSELAKAVR